MKYVSYRLREINDFDFDWFDVPSIPGAPEPCWPMKPPKHGVEFSTVPAWSAWAMIPVPGASEPCWPLKPPKHGVVFIPVPAWNAWAMIPVPEASGPCWALKAPKDGWGFSSVPVAPEPCSLYLKLLSHAGPWKLPRFGGEQVHWLPVIFAQLGARAEVRQVYSCLLRSHRRMLSGPKKE